MLTAVFLNPVLPCIQFTTFQICALFPQLYEENKANTDSVRDVYYSSFYCQALGFVKFSLLGWSDGGITAMIAAAKNPDVISKMVVWGANAFVSQQDLELYNGNLPV